jgi:hypothetical protein
MGRPCPFQKGKVCPPTTSEAGARWPRRGGTNSTKFLRVLRNGPHDHSPGGMHGPWRLSALLDFSARPPTGPLLSLTFFTLLLSSNFLSVFDVSFLTLTSNNKRVYLSDNFLGSSYNSFLLKFLSPS